MSDIVNPQITDAVTVRCTKCDREVEHYNTFLSPENEQSVVCSECQERKEKGFNAARDFRRQARSGYIPR
jgi:DNA-directed RNA polymerase subunit RPC12/RpoP